MTNLIDMPGMDQFKGRYQEVEEFINNNNIEARLRSILSYIIPGQQPELRLVIGGNPYVDDNLIIVSLSDEYILEDFKTIYIVLLGKLGQGAQYYLSSNYNDYEKETSLMNKKLMDFGFSESLSKKISNTISGKIEEGRINNILCRKLPGMINNIKMLNIHTWEWKPPIGNNKLKDILQTIEFVATLGVYPKGYMDHFSNTIYDEFIEGIKGNILRGINSASCQDALLESHKIIDKLINFLQENYEDVKEDIERAEEIEEITRNLQENTNFKSTKEIEFNEVDRMDGDDKENPSHIEDSFARRNKETIDLKKKDEVEKIIDGEELVTQVSDESGEDDFSNIDELKEKILKESDELVDLEKVSDFDEEVEYDRQKGQISDEEVEGILQGYGNIYNYEYSLNDFPLLDLPRELELKGKRFRKDIEFIFKNRSQMDLMEQNQGVINQADIYKVLMNNYDIFVDEGVKKHSEYVGYILHDGSYSMHRNQKYELSLEALAILEEGLKGIIPLKIVSFRASNIAMHRLIKDFDEESSKNYSYSFYKDSKPENANEDGFSIEIATKELLDRPETDKVLVILSDGMPMNKDKLIEAVKEARRKGIHIVSIFFGTEEFRRDHRKDYIELYQENIISTSPELIPKRLTNLFMKILER